MYFTKIIQISEIVFIISIDSASFSNDNNIFYFIKSYCIMQQLKMSPGRVGQ